MSAAHRWFVLVFNEGKQVYERGFARRSRAAEFYWWRVGLMETREQRTPGDTVILVNEFGSIEEEYDDEGPVLTHRQRLPVPS